MLCRCNGVGKVHLISHEIVVVSDLFLYLCCFLFVLLSIVQLFEMFPIVIFMCGCCFSMDKKKARRSKERQTHFQDRIMHLKWYRMYIVRTSFDYLDTRTNRQWIRSPCSIEDQRLEKPFMIVLLNNSNCKMCTKGKQNSLCIFRNAPQSLPISFSIIYQHYFRMYFKFSWLCLSLCSLLLKWLDWIKCTFIRFWWILCSCCALNQKFTCNLYRIE